jgi:hypothetical protein
MNRLHLARALAVLAFAGPGGVGCETTASSAETAPTPGVLRGAAWRGIGMGESLGGSACWLRGPDGEVRIEVTREVTREGAASHADISPAWGRLLTRGGEGWVVLLTVATAVGGRWGAPLECLAPDRRVRLETLLAVLEGGVEGAGPWPADVRLIAARGVVGARGNGTVPAGRTAAAFNLRLPETAPLRAALEVRGRGRGGGGETWRVCRTAPPDAPDELAIQVTSTRWPGRLELRAAGAWPVVFEPDDVFVPVWSLGDLLTFPEARPGETGAKTGVDAKGDSSAR